MKRYLAILSVIIICLIFFHIRCGFSSVVFTNDDWLVESVTSDLPPDYLAWISFRQDKWHFPPGLFGNYSYPNISSIANTGAIPLFAIPAKILSPILPDTFQYHGLWLMFCWVLQGLFAYLLLEKFNSRRYFPNVIGAVFFIMATPFLDRIVHMNLCGQWIILASLLGYFSKDWGFNKQLGYQMLMQILALHIHPYFILFTFLTGIAALWRYVKADKSGWNKKQLLLSIGGLFGAVFVTGAYLGMFSIGSGAQGWGFGYYSANLNTFINPMGYSQFIMAMPQSTEGQYEGYAYLGVSLLILAIGAIPFIRFKNITVWKSDPLFYVILFLTLFSISNTVGIGRYSLHIPVFKFMEQTAGIFRASGRYIWELYYLLVLSVLAFWINKIPSNPKTAIILSTLLVVQIIEIPVLWQRNDFFKGTYTGLPSQQIWKAVLQKSSFICTVPPYRRHIVSPGDNVHFEYLAARLNKPISSGHLARFDQQVRWDFEERIKEYVNGKPDTLLENATWISDPGHIGEVVSLVNRGVAEMYILDGYVVLIPQSMPELKEILTRSGARKNFRVTSLADYLERFKDKTILLSVQDDAETGLCDEVKVWAKARGAKLSEIPFRASYAAIFQNDLLVADSLNATEKVLLKKAMNSIDVALISGGNIAGSISSIKVNGKEYSLNTRGINLVVVNDIGQIEAVITFDTYSNCYRVEYNTIN